VVHNSIYVSGGYANPIEYRFANTAGVVIANNVLDGRIQARDGASATVSGNYASATPSLFVNAAAGDLHLSAGAAVLRDKVASPPASAGPDWDGQPRLPGSTDIGADEAAAAPIPSTPQNLRIVG
jgi:hypothetical protein